MQTEFEKCFGNHFKMDDHRFLREAVGYLELGMLVEANEALDQIMPIMRSTPNVVAIRLAIYIKAEKWPLAIELAQYMASQRPREPGWWIQLAYATSMGKGIEVAREILLEAEQRFPNEPTIKFNLGCYAAQLGKIEAAKVYVKRAIELDKTFQERAIDDPDLEPIW